MEETKTMDDDSVLSEEEAVDPRVQVELENLNSASNEINLLETELENGRTKFRTFLNESTQSMNLLFRKLGKCVNKARPYYELLKESRRAQSEAQRAAIAFQRANGVYRAAKETVSLAEQKLMSEVAANRVFDSAWQEMLNHATMKFAESEKEKTRNDKEHSDRANEYVSIQHKLHFLEKDIPRSISKARPYFEMKEKLEHHLQAERQNVEDLQRALTCAKARYKASLGQLEAISEAVHHRRQSIIKLPPRTPGVGAESNSDLSDLPSINFDVMSLSDSVSQTSYDEYAPGDNISFDKIRGIYNTPDISNDNPNMVAGTAMNSEKDAPEINTCCISPPVSKSVAAVLTHTRVREASPSRSISSSPECSPVPGDRRSHRRRQSSQKAFPILQGLTATSKQMSPRLMRANVVQGRFQPVLVGSPSTMQGKTSISQQNGGVSQSARVCGVGGGGVRGGEMVAKELTAEEAEFDGVGKGNGKHTSMLREMCKNEEVFV